MSIPRRGQPVGDAILEDALEHSHILAYRFGLLHAVAITPQELDWQDRTGVYDVRFPPGSAAEQDWFSPAPKHFWNPGYVLTGVRQELFNLEEDSPIEVDMTNVTKLNQFKRIVIGPTRIHSEPSFPRIRRDLVGQFLNRAGYKCELQNGKLVILPQNVPPQSQVGPGAKEPRTK